MPLTQLGHKKYYLGIFFKVRIIFPVIRTTLHLQANWYKAEQYCRFHGMHLASINSAEEQRNLEEHIQSFGELRLGYSLLISGGNLSSCFGFGFVSGGRDKEGVGRCGQHCLDIGV